MRNVKSKRCRVILCWNLTSTVLMKGQNDSLRWLSERSFVLDALLFTSHQLLQLTTAIVEISFQFDVVGHIWLAINSGVISWVFFIHTYSGTYSIVKILDRNKESIGSKNRVLWNSKINKICCDLVGFQKNIYYVISWELNKSNSQKHYDPSTWEEDQHNKHCQTLSGYLKQEPEGHRYHTVLANDTFFGDAGFHK